MWQEPLHIMYCTPYTYTITINMGINLFQHRATRAYANHSASRLLIGPVGQDKEITMKAKAEITTDKAQEEDRNWRQFNRAVKALDSDIRNGFMTLEYALGTLETLRDDLALPFCHWLLPRPSLNK